MSIEHTTDPSTYSVARLRAELARAVRRAEAGERVEVTRRGERVAVLLGASEYERLTRPTGSFERDYARFRRDAALDELDLDPGEIFGDLRDPSPGRGFDL